MKIPRLCAPIRSLRWRDAPDAELKFAPEPNEWVIRWKDVANAGQVIEIMFDAPPLLPQDCPTPAATGDGTLLLHAYQAATHGEKLRFEPQWYKNTVGYWTMPDDYATWKLRLDQPGTYSVAILQGCGNGQGGSDVLLSLRTGDQVTAELPFQIVETGHFQNFRWNH
ncbi:MAG: hypothetical protein KDA75_23430, partial [Planctomycetaceae bacterium]|nr:hypothetical protein [Planctomycetaceae bacterium]